MVEAPAVTVQEEDGSDIDGGNVDNFPTVPLPPGFKEEPEGSDSNDGNVDNVPTVRPGFSPTPRYKKPRIPPFPPIAIMSNDDEEKDDDESNKDTGSEASSSGNGGGSGVDQ